MIGYKILLLPATTSGGSSIMQPTRIPENMRNGSLLIRSIGVIWNNYISQQYCSPVITSLVISIYFYINSPDI